MESTRKFPAYEKRTLFQIDLHREDIYNHNRTCTENQIERNITMKDTGKTAYCCGKKPNDAKTSLGFWAYSVMEKVMTITAALLKYRLRE